MTFTSHEEILQTIGEIVSGNSDAQCSQHGREILDDIINDLIQFRADLPSIDQYIDANEL